MASNPPCQLMILLLAQPKYMRGTVTCMMQGSSKKAGAPAERAACLGSGDGDSDASDGVEAVRRIDVRP